MRGRPSRTSYYVPYPTLVSYNTTMLIVHLTADADAEGHLTLDVPESMQGRELQVTLSLEEPCDANGWPIGFKERFLGAFPDFPDIEDQPDEDVEPIR